MTNKIRFRLRPHPSAPSESSEKHRELVDYIQVHGENLTDWEDEFISDMDDKLKMGSRLSDKQEAIVERIYRERTDQRGSRRYE